MKRYLKQVVYNTLKLLGITIITTDRSVHEFDHTFERLAWMRDQGFKPSEIFDIGASNGRWTRKCVKVFPEARYFCVDPLEENQEGLSILKAEQTRFDFWQGCLGPKPGTAILNMDGSGSSILPGHKGNPYGVQKDVPVETLDNLISMGICRQPDLIKIDVQGYELEVFKGAPQALSNSQAVISETSFVSFQKGMPMLHEVIGELAEYGYVLYDILSLKLRPLDGTAGQSDLLFLKADHVLRSSNKWDHDSVY
jgi:FkbM family methyltransferase